MHSVSSVVNVGISDLNIVKAPHTIRTLGLGSCVGIVIYDQHQKIAGLSHIMLPNSELKNQTELNAYKYADTAIPLLVEKLHQHGARKYALKAKISGGAQMFKFETSNDSMRIGPRNIEAVQQKLEEMNIPIISKDVGGKKGRTIEFDPLTSMLEVRTVYKDITFI